MKKNESMRRNTNLLDSSLEASSTKYESLFIHKEFRLFLSTTGTLRYKLRKHDVSQKIWINARPKKHDNS